MVEVVVAVLVVVVIVVVVCERGRGGGGGRVFFLGHLQRALASMPRKLRTRVPREASQTKLLELPEEQQTSKHRFPPTVSTASRLQSNHEP